MTEEEQRPGLRRSMVTSSLWSLLEVISDRLLALVVILLLARLVGPEQFGVVAIAVALLAMSEAVASTGFANAVVQRRELTADHIASAFWGNLLLSLALAAGLALAAPAIADIYGQRELALVLQVLCTNLVLVGAMSVPAAMLKRAFQYQWLALRPFAATVLGGGVSVYLAFAGYGVWALVSYYVLRMFANTTLILLGIRWRPQLRLRWTCVRDLVGFSLSDMGTQLLAVGNQRCRDLIVGYGLGPAATGQLRLGQQFVEMLANATIVPVERVTLTGLSKIQNDLSRVGNLYLSMVLVLGAIGIPGAGGLIIVLPDVVAWLLGPAWSESAVIGQILPLIFPFYCFAFLLRPAMQAIGRPGVAFGFSIAEFIGTQAVTFMAAPHGLQAVALAMIAFVYLLLPYALWLLRRYLGVTVSALIRQITPSTVATAVMIAVGLGVHPWLQPALPAPGVVAAEAALGGITYLAVLRLFWPAFLSRVAETVSPNGAQALRRTFAARVLLP